MNSGYEETKKDWRVHSGWGVIGPKAFKSGYQPEMRSEIQQNKTKFDPNKLYTISTAISNGMVADVSKDLLTSDQLVLFNNQGSSNQRFRIQ